MTHVLIRVVAQFAIFLEASDESLLAMDVAVRQQEELAYHLQQLTPSERDEFVRLLEAVAKEESSAEHREILAQLPRAVGIM